jgi:hypothetical protein
MSNSNWASTPVASAPAGYTSTLIDPPLIGWKFTTASTIGCVVFVVAIGLRLTIGVSFCELYLMMTVGATESPYHIQTDQTDISIFALVAWFVCFAVFTLDVRYGMGKHIWDVTCSDHISSRQNLIGLFF